MDTSIFIAKLFGLMYTVVGLGMVLNGKYYKKAVDAMLKEVAVWYLGGIMALFLGFLIVMAHNVWELSWVLLVTLIGWGAMLKGVFLLMFPEWMLKFSTSLFKKTKSFSGLGIFVVLLGFVFVYFGFIA